MTDALNILSTSVTQVTPPPAEDISFIILFHIQDDSKASRIETVQKRSNARRARTGLRGVYKYTLSDAVCSTTQQVSIFQ
jgi:hypothetical protein